MTFGQQGSKIEMFDGLHLPISSGRTLARQQELESRSVSQ